MSRYYFLDTNVLLHDSQSIFKFKKHTVVIPIWVVEEIDKFKREATEVGRNARAVSRALDSLRASGLLAKGVSLPNGGKLQVVFEVNSVNLPKSLHENSADNLILSAALNYQRKKHKVIVVTKDTNLRIRADALGLIAEDYETDKVPIEELYGGWREISIKSTDLNTLYKDHFLPFDGIFPNECFLVRDSESGGHSALGLYDAQKKGICFLDDLKPVWGILPRNKEQRFALELLLNDKISLVTLVGKAGTGKTLLALAAGLHKVTDTESYCRLLATRPIVPLGRDIGFLPGEMGEKLRPWMQPIVDNIEFLLNISHDKRRDAYQELVDQKILQVEALTYIRGRSIPNQFIIIDEAQNLTPHEVKTIITRAGERSKVVLTGDPYQIDNPYIDSSSNGLTYVAERFKGQDIAGHITLTKGERSGLAEIAANIL